MLFATAGQGTMAVWMAACGAVIGLWYGMTAALRHILRAGFWLTLILDLAFGAGCAGILLFFLVTGNYGRLRLYEILAAGCGAGLFLFAAAPLARRLKSCARRIMTVMAENRLIKVIFK